MPRKKPKTPNDYLALPRCGNCRHWRRLDDSEQMPAEDVLGECLRYPPLVIGMNEDGEVVQGSPIVEARHYCGEHGPAGELMKILLLDIETAPNLAYVWGLWQQNVGINQIEDNGYVLCWSAKWLGEDKVMFDSIKKSDEKVMLGRIHRLVSQADALVHYNGQKFDLPVLNREWLRHGFTPPSPAKHIDLLRICKRQFRFVSNKLDYVSQFLGLGAKTKHTGHELWVGCMKGDRDSWKTMEAYNRQDVALLESLYNRLLPWIYNHPSHGAKEGVSCCPKCGSEDFQQRGHAVTTTYKYRRYQCRSCGGWFRGSKTVTPRLPVGEERFVNSAA